MTLGMLRVETLSWSTVGQRGTSTDCEGPTASEAHDYKEWRIGVDLDAASDGSPRATVRVFEPGMGPRSQTGLGLGLHGGRTPQEAEAKAVEAAKQWIDRQPPSSNSAAG